MMDLFEIHAKAALNRAASLLVLLAAFLPVQGLCQIQAADAQSVEHAQTLDELRQSMESLIEKTFVDRRLFYCCELIRSYVELFPSSDSSYLYLSDPEKSSGRTGKGEVITLRGIKGRLLERGRESFAKANLADQRLTAFYLTQKVSRQADNSLAEAIKGEAKRLAGGDEALANIMVQKHEATVGLYLDAALFLSAHCLIFPNSADSHRQLGDAVKCAEIADLPLLEVELRSRLMDQKKDTPAFKDAKQLSEKAAHKKRFFIAISALDRFLSENYSHPMAGRGYLASGDIHLLAGCYDVAISKYNQALLWSGDMEKTNNSEGGGADLFSDDVVGVKKKASLSIGYALLAEAKGKHLRESTAVFAGKLHEEAVTHFDRLVEQVEPGSLSGLDYLLGQIRARAEEAWYKRAHSNVLGTSEIQDAYARCLSACEIYLRVLGQAQAEGGDSTKMNAENRDEVAYVLLESLFAMDKIVEGEALFFRYFIRPEGRGASKWAVFAKTRIAKRLVDSGDYLTAYSLLSELVKEAQQLGLRDVGFTAALMAGVCVSKLKPVALGTGGARLSEVQMERESYSRALAVLNDSFDSDPALYPDEFRDLFLGNIREALTEEYRSQMSALRSSWSPLDPPARETLLVDALTALDPGRYPFNPNNLLVAAYLDAHREVEESIALNAKKTTQNGAISQK